MNCLFCAAALAPEAVFCSRCGSRISGQRPQGGVLTLDPSSSAGSAVSHDERYRRICSQINLYSERMQQSFARFVQLSLATIGGFIWLKTQANTADVGNVLYIARWILPALAGLTILELYLDHRGWWNYRVDEAKHLNNPKRAPNKDSGRSEKVKAAAVAVIGVGGFFVLQ